MASFADTALNHHSLTHCDLLKLGCIEDTILRIKLVYNLTTVCLNRILPYVDFIDVIMGDIALRVIKKVLKQLIISN